MKRDLKRGMGLVRAQLVASVALLILGLPILSAFKGEIVFLVVGLVLNLSAIYITGWNDGFRDSKNMGESIPDIPRAIKVSFMAAVVPTVLLLLRVLAYHLCVGSGQETSVFLKTTDVIYRIFYFYFTHFMQSGSLTAYIIPIIIPLVVYPIGYAIGTKRFDVFEKYLPKILYKDKGKK